MITVILILLKYLTTTKLSKTNCIPRTTHKEKKISHRNENKVENSKCKSLF